MSEFTCKIYLHTTEGAHLKAKELEEKLPDMKEALETLEEKVQQLKEDKKTILAEHDSVYARFLELDKIADRSEKEEKEYQLVKEKLAGVAKKEDEIRSEITKKSKEVLSASTLLRKTETQIKSKKVTRSYHSGETSAFRSAFESDKEEPILYSFSTDCRETLIVTIRDIVRPYLYSRFGTSIGYSGSIDVVREFPDLQIVVINNKTKLSTDGIVNIQRFLTTILTRGSRLNVSFGEDRMYINCALRPIWISSVMWIWRTFPRYLNNASRVEKRTWGNRTLFREFWEEQFDKYLNGEESSFYCFEHFWIYAWEVIERGYYGTANNFDEEAYWNGPVTWFRKSVKEDAKMRAVFLKAISYYASRKNEKYVNVIEEELLQYSPIFKLQLELRDILNKLDDAKGSELFSAIHSLVQIIRRFIQRTDIV